MNRTLKTLLIMTNFFVMIIGFWLWQEFDEAFFRISGLLLIVLALFLYRRYLR